MSDVLPFVFSFPEDGENTPKYNGACTYLICSPDGKPYVGQAQKFYKRMVAHKTNGKQAWVNHAKYQAGKRKNKVCPISFAINKHGWENMEIIILEKYVVWDQQLLDSREQYFIRFYDSFKNGYNCNEGGNRCKPPPCSEETKAKLSKPVTSCEIKEEYSDGTQLVKFVQYPSAAEAARQTGILFGDISNAARRIRRRKSAGGRYWFFTKENHPPQIIKVGTIRVPRIGHKPGNEKPIISVLRLVGGGAIEQYHISIAEGIKTLSSPRKTFNNSCICRCCTRERTQHHGYNFRYVTTEKREDFDDDGKRTVEIWNGDLYTSKKRKRK